MLRKGVDAPRVAVVFCLVLITGTSVAAGDSLESDREVLLNLKAYLEKGNHVNKGKYSTWHSNNSSSSPCNWPGISCSGDRVTGIDLSGSNISGEIFGNFSALTALTSLDLSENTIGGSFPSDLGECHNLKVLNLSHNIISGELNLYGLNSLESLDLSTNRIFSEIGLTFPGNCKNLVSVNLSNNNLTGSITNSFDACRKLQLLDLTANRFTGELWQGFTRLEEFSVSENRFSGVVPPDFFRKNCSLRVLDLSENNFRGSFPSEISNCRQLAVLNLRENNFTGEIPGEIGQISGLEALYLGNNSFSRKIPESLLGLKNLILLDLSRNHFGGELQEIFGRFANIRSLVLHSNSYTDGIHSSGILNLPNVSRLDLSFNNFTGPLPVEISKMTSLKFFILANNRFSGNIPPDYGYLPSLQVLDLSFNRLNGSIPPSLGNLSSLLWLMLANNELTGEIPPELGNCKSLLWLNLANNRLSGPIPREMTKIGHDATSTFALNREGIRVTAGSGECLAMKRWIPADYPPFCFVYTLLTSRSCIGLWDKLLKGYGIFPLCGNVTRDYRISGYIQLTGNRFSGEIPPEIGEMKNFGMIHIGYNGFYGNIPTEIARMPLINLNVTRNKFSGKIPSEMGDMKCLQNLDLSYNNFSGEFPASLSNLTELNKFNVSYNPYITGAIPTVGQLATFEEDSFLGNPLLRLPPFLNASSVDPTDKEDKKGSRAKNLGPALVFLAVMLASLVCGAMSLLPRVFAKIPIGNPNCVSEDQKGRDPFVPSSISSSGPVKVIRLDKTAFTHADIRKATSNFSDDRIIGRGGYGTVYRGTLPDNREIAVKKLRGDGREGEKEFLAEMEVLSGNQSGWPHPNLVTLYGWCLDGSEKLLIYEYMSGGSLEDLITVRTRLKSKRRLDIAIDVASALVFLHHECFPPIVHRDVKASNVLLHRDGRATVTDFGLARMVNVDDSHVSTVVAGTVGYVAPEYGHTWQATTKGDVYSFGVLAMELATSMRAISGGDECLVEWARRVVGPALRETSTKVLRPWVVEGTQEMCELLKVGFWCTAEVPQARPNMKEVLAMLVKVGTLTH